MTNAMTLRLDETTARELAELAEGHRSRSAAVVAAIHLAWTKLQAERLEAGYEAAMMADPNYPYESEHERAALRERRSRRQKQAEAG